MDLLSKHTQFQSKPFILFSILVVFSLFWKNKCRAIFCFKREWASVSYFQKLSNYLEWRYYALKLSLTVGRVDMFGAKIISNFQKKIILEVCLSGL